ncbi:hypothetical protein QFZ75_007881 [Streptomyces sp. V3I8]|uniref:hypothetical protein n=1 Tax=Streptomyces sp. V3I8 TaxID=3042279 RepID=UPI00277D2E73|nr:hypothetical protein [Streptomyces sp. V3I8]MDQ1041379.1 hypothetical protein [Streptomyces sp. V3I8]
MAELIAGDDIPQEAVRPGSIDPFGGDSQTFTWGRDVQVGQLQAELDAEVGPEVRIVVAFPRDGEGEVVAVDAQNPLTVYVTPSSADVAAVRQLMGAHKPDPYFGMSDEERQDAQLREKIAAGQDLTQQEMQRAFRLLVA